MSSPPGPPRSAGWARILVACAAVVALLLVGIAAGLLIAQSRPAPDSGAPAVDSVAVGFCQDMTVHHRQAVRMAGIVRERSTDPAVKNVAFDIETNQIEQIGRMQGWLNLWGRDPLPVAGHMAWMRSAEAPHGHTASSAGASVTVMPGMASDADLTRLNQLESPELDVLFLQLMLRHHQGGIPMMRYAADHAEAGVVRNLASQMAVSQNSETELLTHMITERGGTPLPPPN